MLSLTTPSRQTPQSPAARHSKRKVRCPKAAQNMAVQGRVALKVVLYWGAEGRTSLTARGNLILESWNCAAQGHNVVKV